MSEKKATNENLMHCTLVGSNVAKHLCPDDLNSGGFLRAYADVYNVFSFYEQFNAHFSRVAFAVVAMRF